MHATPDSTPADLLGLAGSALVVGGHRFVERELFGLTGRWSLEAAGAAAQGDTGAGAVADFLATQSVIHSWRLAEWEQRSPRSLEVSEGPEHPGWSAALSIVDRAPSVEAKLASWSHVLAVALAARYRRHRSMCSAAADRGTLRWLDIAERDVLDGVAQGAVLVRDRVGRAGSDPVASADSVAGAVADAMRALAQGSP